MPNTRLFALLSLGLLTLLFASGCGRYQLGRHAEPPFRSIYIRPVANDTFAAQAQAILSHQLRNQFIRDGLLEVDNERDADAVLEVVLHQFDRRVAATRAEDTEVAEKLELDLLAHCTLVDNRSGEVYFRDRPLTATAESFPQDRPQQAEFQAMPVLAERLARQIAYQVLQVW